MPTLEWIGKSKVINHHQDVPFRVLERKYSFDENGQHDEDRELRRGHGEDAARQAEGEDEAQDAKRGDDAPRNVEASRRGPRSPAGQAAPRQEQGDDRDGEVDDEDDVPG